MCKNRDPQLSRNEVKQMIQTLLEKMDVVQQTTIQVIQIY